MREALCIPFLAPSGGDQLYRIMRQHFWWPNMKREIAEFVSYCMTCQKVKAEHQRPQGLLHPLPVPE